MGLAEMMEFGLSLQNNKWGAGGEGLDASAEMAERFGWQTVWAADHMIVSKAGGETEKYAWILEMLLSLTYVAARHQRAKVAAGVCVPAMRDAPQLAKELATLDHLSGGRLIVGIGVGDKHDFGEYSNLGKADRFRKRGAYLNETVALWRHLWSGSEKPFRGEFHQLEDYVFTPLPKQKENLLIISGGRSDRALERVGSLTDGLYAARWGPEELRPRWPAILERARANGRRKPFLAARVRVRFEQDPDELYSLCGTPDEMTTQLFELEEVGLDEFVAVFEEAVEPDDIVAACERFERDVVAPYREQRAARDEQRR